MDYLAVVDSSEVKFDFAVCFKYLLKRCIQKQEQVLPWAKAFFKTCDISSIGVSPEDAVAYYDVITNEAMLAGSSLLFYRYGDSDLDGMAFREAVLSDDSIEVPNKCLAYARDIDVQDLPCRNGRSSTISLCSLCRNSTKGYNQEFRDYEYQLLRFFCQRRANMEFGLENSSSPARAFFSYSEDITADFPDYVFKNYGPVLLTGLREYALIVFGKKFDWGLMETVSLDGRSPIERVLEALKSEAVEKFASSLEKSLQAQGFDKDDARKEQWKTIVSSYFDKINARLSKTIVAKPGTIRNIISEIDNKRNGRVITPKKPAPIPDEEQAAEVDAAVESPAGENGYTEGETGDPSGVMDGDTFEPEQMPDDTEFADKGDGDGEDGKKEDTTLPAQKERRGVSMADLSGFHHVVLGQPEFDRFSVPSSDSALIAKQLRRNKILPSEVAFFGSRACIVVYDLVACCYYVFTLDQLCNSVELSSIFTGKGVQKVSWESTLLYGVLVLGDVRPRNVLSLKEGHKMIKGGNETLYSAIGFYADILKKKLSAGGSGDALEAMRGYKEIFTVQQNYFLAKKLEDDYKRKNAFCTVVGYSLFRGMSLADNGLLFVNGEKGMEYCPLAELNPRREGVILNYSLDTDIEGVLSVDILISGLIEVALRDKFRTMDIQLLRVDAQHGLMTIFCGLEYEDFFRTWLQSIYHKYASGHTGKRFHLVCDVRVSRSNMPDPDADAKLQDGEGFEEIPLDDTLPALKTPDVTLEVSPSRLEFSKGTDVEKILRGAWKFGIRGAK